MQVTVEVNGEEHTRELESRLLRVHFLRDELGLTGTHWGCDTSNCGTCVVLMDGYPVKSCPVLAATAAGHQIRTVEGLEVDGILDPGDPRGDLRSDLSLHRLRDDRQIDPLGCRALDRGDCELMVQTSKPGGVA